MSIKELREEVAVGLLEGIKKTSENKDYQDPESLKVLAEAYATVAEFAPRKTPSPRASFG